MQCGIFHTPYALPSRTPRQIFDWSLDIAQLADEAGYADFMIGEHYTTAWENIPLPEAIIAGAAQNTKTIRFAPMAHPLPYHDPATLAIRIGWLSQVLEGRYFLGISAGGQRTDAILHGHDDISDLAPRQLEALELMEKVWRREPFRENGRYFQAGFPGPGDISDFPVAIADNSLWGGRSALEIAVTGLSRSSSSLKFAGERNYSPISFFGGTRQMNIHWRTWAEAAENAGYKVDRSRYRICRDIFIADTDAEATLRAKRSGMARVWESYLHDIYKKLRLYDGLIEDSGLDIAPEDIGLDFLAEHVWLCGSPATVADKLRQLVDRTGGWGQLVVIQHDSIDDPEPWAESLRRLVQEVAPRVRSLPTAPSA